MSVARSEGKGKVVVVMPAYNAARTLAATVAEMPDNCADEVILVDDGSTDDTVARARELGLMVVVHPENRGYGGNQKTCYRLALERGAEYVVMIHPDYQYDSRLIPVAVEVVRLGVCDMVLGNRVRTRRECLAGGMPLYKYLANRFLTIVENLILGQNLGECHSGFRVYRRKVLETIPFERNSNDFVFDSQFLCQAVCFNFKVGDIPMPTRYFPESSSINFRRSAVYGMRTLFVLVQYLLHRSGIVRVPLFLPRCRA